MPFAILFLFLFATRLAHADSPPSDATKAPPDATNAPAALPPIEPWPFALPDSSPPAAPASRPYSRLAAAVSAGIGTAAIGNIDSAIDYYSYGERGMVQTLAADVGIRVNERLMLGLHAGAASKTTFVDGFSDFLGTHETHYGVRTIHYGVTAQLAVTHNVWLAPWLGVQDSMRHADCYLDDDGAVYGSPSTMECEPTSQSWDYHFDLQPAYGLSAGVDVYEQGGRRVSLVVAAMRSSVTPIDGQPYFKGSYSSLSLDVAYRFWR
jgi:hypothetical protein